MEQVLGVELDAVEGLGSEVGKRASRKGSGTGSKAQASLSQSLELQTEAAGHPYG